MTIAQDTESYYTLLYKWKINRWLLRYDVNRKRHTLQFRIPLTEQHRSEISRAGLEIGPADSLYLDCPEHLYRVAGLLYDSLDYCRNDDNFRRLGSGDDQEAA